MIYTVQERYTLTKEPAVVRIATEAEEVIGSWNPVSGFAWVRSVIPESEFTALAAACTRVFAGPWSAQVATVAAAPPEGGPRPVRRYNATKGRETTTKVANVVRLMNGAATVAGVASILGLSRISVSRKLKQLKADGAVTATDHGPGYPFTYTVNEKG